MVTTAVSVTAYLYPWDVIGDPDAVSRLQQLGVRRVALAAIYHSVRAATPRHPSHRQVTLARTTALVPASADYPEGLVPDRAPEHAWQDAAAPLRAAGIEVCAWVVLTHVDGFDARADSHRVDAFGDVMDYALCPATPRAREYAEAVLAEVLAATGDAPLILEAVAAGGWQHGGAHDKASDRVSAVESALLSQCFCETCSARLTESGVDVDDVRRRIRAAADPLDVESALGGASEVLRVHHLAVAADAVAHALAVTREREVTLHATATATATATETATATTTAAEGAAIATTGAWYTGPSAPVDAAADLSGVTLVASAWDSAANALERVGALRAQHPSSPIGAYLPFLGRDDVAAEIEKLLTGGVQSLHLYHVGLTNARESAGAARAIAAIEGFVTKGTGE